LKRNGLTEKSGSVHFARQENICSDLPLEAAPIDKSNPPEEFGRRKQSPAGGPAASYGLYPVQCRSDRSWIGGARVPWYSLNNSPDIIGGRCRVLSVVYYVELKAREIEF